jgi:hypothetical protein
VAAALIFLTLQQPHPTQPTIFLIGIRLAKIAQVKLTGRCRKPWKGLLHLPGKANN